MKLFVASLFLLFSATSFAGVICNTYDRVVDFAVETVQEELECAATEQVDADMRGYFAKLGLCSEEAQFIGPANCKMIANMIVAALDSNLPESWECSMDKFGTELEERFVSLCGG